MTTTTSTTGARAAGTRSHIAVLGAGMAGLAAAAAASTVADRVTVVDGDRLPDGAEVRRGTPQARHIHALLAGGRRALETLLPGFDARLEQAGAREVTHGSGFAFRGSHGWLHAVPDLLLRCASRPVIEATVRGMVRERANVEIVDGWHVDRLTADRSGRVNGVVGTRDGRPAALEADLVIDATGRGSAAPSWLDELGYEAPEEQVVDPSVWYATMVGHGDADLPEGMHGLVVMPTDSCPAGGGMTPNEDGSYTVSLTGVGGPRPPRDEGAFRDHAHRLPSPVIARAIAPLNLQGPIASSRSTTNRRRRYDRVRLPDRFLLIGDSVCALDPIYGQGMTVAAVQAATLHSLLGELGVHHPDLGTRFQERAWRIAKVAWDQAVAADRQLPTVDATPPLAARPVIAYVERVQQLCTVDEATARRFGRIMHLLDPPTGLFHPAIIGKVLREVLRPGSIAAGPDTTARAAQLG